MALVTIARVLLVVVSLSGAPLTLQSQWHASSRLVTGTARTSPAEGLGAAIAGGGGRKQLSCLPCTPVSFRGDPETLCMVSSLWSY